MMPEHFFVWGTFREGSWQPQISMRAGEILAALGTPGQVDGVWSDLAVVSRWHRVLPVW